MSPPGTSIRAVPRVEKKLRLTEEAWAALDRYCERHHITFNVLIESIGQHLADHPEWLPDEIAERAQRIDRERYSRRPRD